MIENKILITAGDMVMTDDGTAIVLRIDRAGIEMRDVRGQVSWVEWPDLKTVAPVDGTQPDDPPALRSFADVWNRLDGETRSERSMSSCVESCGLF